MKLPRFQFRLRTLLIVVTVLDVACVFTSAGRTFEVMDIDWYPNV